MSTYSHLSTRNALLAAIHEYTSFLDKYPEDHQLLTKEIDQLQHRLKQLEKLEYEVNTEDNQADSDSDSDSEEISPIAMHNLSSEESIFSWKDEGFYDHGDENEEDSDHDGVKAHTGDSTECLNCQLQEVICACPGRYKCDDEPCRKARHGWYRCASCSQGP
ncbi:hypothetical protein ASPWEDRAFT_37173 [Aspergillus wentii DTO 134E9]|uniref:Uncharacterized protein n=1 Tax=Aspergillus wentii DTO 134E9 TaxID=1073089 RepID=A0A1L9RWZ0_ASPWE|nr:uncharacterized protein ASPWEDRAFT_37173 [Aspergillus wentii DTO 134E9]KAI9928923.1 hypothetical protein MW887_001316 [Aspergillus wentii]OJJ39394.1 hypothetical protein ASPWEDRAFT_37173 [Aspergillus wentii DTO 134E9]